LRCNHRGLTDLRSSYPAHAGYPVRRGPSIPSRTPRNTGSPAGACHRAPRRADPVADDDEWGYAALFADTVSRSRRAKTPELQNPSIKTEGAGNAGRSMRPQPRVQCRKHTSVVTTVTPESPGIPRAMVLTVSFVLSSVTGLVCHRHQRIKVLSAPGRARKTSANLTPASGRRDHTTSPSAASVYAKGLGGLSAEALAKAKSICRQRAVIAHGKPALPSSRAPQCCRVHRIPPDVRDDHDTPLRWDGMVRI